MGTGRLPLKRQVFAAHGFEREGWKDTQADLVHRIPSINCKDQFDSRWQLVTLLVMILYIGFPMSAKHIVGLHTIQKSLHEI